MNSRKKSRNILFILLLLYFLCCNKKESTNSIFRLTIIHTNDIHGHFFKEKDVGWEKEGSNGAALASWIKSVLRYNKSRGIPTLILDGGDFYSGTPEGNMTKGRSILQVMEKLGYNGIVVGNHEFDNGKENLAELTAISKVPILGANIIDKNTKKIFDKLIPYLVFNLGIKVAVIGVTTPQTPISTLPSNVEGLEFKEPEESIDYYQKIITQKEKKIFFVVLSHLGLERDKLLAKHNKKISVIIGGHSHTLLEKPILFNSTIICQAGFNGKYSGKLELWIDKKTLKVTSYKYNLFKIMEGDFSSDPQIESFLNKIQSSINLNLDEVIGYTEGDIIPDDENESYIGNIITDAMRDRTKVEIAFHNAHGIRHSIPKGEIRLRQIFMVLPFDDTLYTMELQGRQIKELLKQALSNKMQHGMIQLSGIKVNYKIEKSKLAFVSIIKDDGKKIEDDIYYSVVTNSFLAKGGDGLYIFLGGKNRKDTGILLRDAVTEHIKKISPLKPAEFNSTRIIQLP